MSNFGQGCTLAATGGGATADRKSPLLIYPVSFERVMASSDDRKQAHDTSLVVRQGRATSASVTRLIPSTIHHLSFGLSGCHAAIRDLGWQCCDLRLRLDMRNDLI